MRRNPSEPIHRYNRCAVILMTLVIAAPCLGQTCPSVTPIRSLPGVTVPEVATATGLSADGSVVVGRVADASGRFQPYRWGPTDSGPAMIVFGSLDPFFGNVASDQIAHVGVSPDGETVVGTSGRHPVTWTIEGGLVELPDFSATNGFSGGVAFDASVGGNVVVGGFQAFETVAARWTQTEGIESLGVLDGFTSRANAVSADGSIVTGTSDSPESPFALQAFSWTAEEGMVGLGDLPGGDFSSEANDISADGTTIVGGSWSESGFEAFIWTADTGMFGLGDLPRGDFNSTALGVSADGSVVVGRSDSGSSHLPTDAMIWSADEGMRKLKDVLQDDFGLDLFTVILTSATAVSDDGRTIIGQGCFGSRCASPITIEPWIATLPDAIAFDRSLCSGLLEPDETDGVDPEETNPGDTDDLTGNSNTASPAGGRPNRPCGSGILAYTLVLGAVLGFLPRVRRRRA